MKQQMKQTWSNHAGGVTAGVGIPSVTAIGSALGWAPKSVIIACNMVALAAAAFSYASSHGGVWGILKSLWKGSAG